MSTYQSISTYTFDTTGNSPVVTKPSGLAVGDLMLAGFAHVDAYASTLGTPSGWTARGTVSGGSPVFGITLFSKIADSGDVAASNFTFSASVSNIGGFLIRFSAPGTIDVGYSENYASVNAGSHSFSGFTPTKANSTFVFFGFRGTTTAGSAMDITSVSIATDNPTWTERGQTTETTADRLVFAVYTASRSQTSSTGNVTFNFTNIGSGIDTNGILLALSPQVSGSFSAPDVEINAYAPTPVQSVKLNAYSAAPITAISQSPTEWTNPDKPSTTWTNPDK